MPTSEEYIKLNQLKTQDLPERGKERQEQSEPVSDTEVIAEDHVTQYEYNISVGDCPDYGAIFDDQSEYESDPMSEFEETFYDTVEAEDEENDQASQKIMMNIDRIANDWEGNIDEGLPFRDPQAMIMMCLCNNYSTLLSRSQLKTVLYAVQKIVELVIKITKENKPFCLPSANFIMKADKNQSYDGPSMATSIISHIVTVKCEQKKVE